MSFGLYFIIGIAPITTSIYYYISRSNNKIENDWEIIENDEKNQLNNSFYELNLDNIYKNKIYLDEIKHKQIKF